MVLRAGGIIRGRRLQDAQNDTRILGFVGCCLKAEPGLPQFRFRGNGSGWPPKYGDPIAASGPQKQSCLACKVEALLTGPPSEGG